MMASLLKRKTLAREVVQIAALLVAPFFSLGLHCATGRSRIMVTAIISGLAAAAFVYLGQTLGGPPALAADVTVDPMSLLTCVILAVYLQVGAGFLARWGMDSGDVMRAAVCGVFAGALVVGSGYPLTEKGTELTVKAERVRERTDAYAAKLVLIDSAYPRGSAEWQAARHRLISEFDTMMMGRPAVPRG